MNFATLEPLNLSHKKQGKTVEIYETNLGGSKVAKFMEKLNYDHLNDLNAHQMILLDLTLPSCYFLLTLTLPQKLFFQQPANLRMVCLMHIVL